MRASFNYLAQVCINFSEISLVDSLRKRIFEQLEAQTLNYFNYKKSGELVNILTNEMERIRQLFGGIAFFITRSFAIIVYSASLFMLSWKLSIVAILLFSLVAVGLSTLNKQIRERSFGITTANDKFTSRTLEFIEGIRTIHAFSTQEFERERYYQASEKIVDTVKSIDVISLVVKPVAESVSTLILIGMIIVALTTGLMEVSALLTFCFVLFRIIPMIQDINGVLAFLTTQTGAVENIKDLLKSDGKVYFKNGTLKFPGLKRSIDLVSVDFDYNHNQQVLHNITLSIKQGEMTALVGGSGAGKTTLADLIPRFHDATEGYIYIDDVDIRKFEIHSLRRQIAVVSQNTFIFNTSVWKNIAYGTPTATEAEIKEAAKLANALEFIEEMPEGFRTQLGDRGVRLSGGQKQRIAIARALLRNPEILILDEATSALDSVSERLIQESLEQLSLGRTVIVIAHRLSTIAKANKVVVLEQGRIVEQGKYQELLEMQGKLWQYHQMQYEMTPNNDI
jgi:subfamily B ATP-binding cassette protein MsbA